MSRALLSGSVRSLVWSSLALSFLVAPLGSALEAQQPGARVHGARVAIVQPPGPVLRGELLAVEEQQLWIVNAGNAVQAVPLTDVQQVRVQRHDWTAGRIAIWTAVVGGTTTAGMFGACASYGEPGGCATFALVWAGLWAGVGALSGLLVQPSLRVPPTATETLRAHARFPQGLPDGFAPQGTNPSAPNGAREVDPAIEGSARW